MVAPKQRPTVRARAVVEETDALPLRTAKRSRTTLGRPVGSADDPETARIVADALAFLSADSISEASHVPAFYRFAANDPGHWTATVHEKGDQRSSLKDAVATAVGFPSPFLAVDLNDRHGIWQTDPPLVRALGDDPRKQLRANQGAFGAAPAGLMNLGATCYLNSLLQYLFFNVDFRHRLLRASSESAVVGALQKVFALLAEGDHSTVDPGEFVKAARVDALEQEDATEFSALLLDWLERELGTDQAKGGGNFIPELFQGEICQILQCMTHAEHKFERREPFIELRARITPTSGSTAGVGEGTPKIKTKIKGPGPTLRLEQLLADTAFPDEVLNGSNQYHCDLCNGKVDARKTMRLAKLPPYLNITIERHHYDLQKGERRKLHNVVSFPRQLKLWLHEAPLPNEMDCHAVSTCGQQVVYECIGYLEHVSDSALTGHYTATLLQDDANAVEAMQEASERETPSSQDISCASAKVAHLQEPSVKRARCDGAEVADGVQSPSRWWTLDDDTVSAVNWTPAAAQSGTTATVCGNEASKHTSSCSVPDRIESQSAYLVLYRQSNHVPGRLAASDTCIPPALPAPLASYVSSVNSNFATEQKLFAAKANKVDEFMNERRQAVNSLVKVLREEQVLDQVASVNQSLDPSNYSVVPTAWWNAFLRGEDKSLDDLIGEDEVQKVAPVMYGHALLSGRGNYKMETVDPLALWCGEVKLLPTSALEAMGGLGGLDKSLFIQTESALSQEPCEAVLHVFKIWCKEQQLIAHTLQGKRTFAEARVFQSKSPDDDPVWISVYLHNVWKKAVSNGVDDLAVLWRGFLAEVHQLRWGYLANGASITKEIYSGDASVAHGAKSTPGDLPAKDLPTCTTRTVDVDHPAFTCNRSTGEISLLGNILCEHGLVGKPRSGILVRRADVTELLAISAEKSQAYSALWPRLRSVPRLCTGLSNGRLLDCNNLCPECHPQGGRYASSSLQEMPVHRQRRIIVKLRYSSGNIRKKGELSLGADGDGITGDALRALVKEQLKVPVLKLFVPSSEAPGDLKELQSTDVLGEDVASIVIEKDEPAASGHREVAAFEGSIFRTRSS